MENHNTITSFQDYHEKHFLYEKDGIRIDCRYNHKERGAYHLRWDYEAYLDGELGDVSHVGTPIFGRHNDDPKYILGLILSALTLSEWDVEEEFFAHRPNDIFVRWAHTIDAQSLSSDANWLMGEDIDSDNWDESDIEQAIEEHMAALTQDY